MDRVLNYKKLVKQSRANFETKKLGFINKKNKCVCRVGEANVSNDPKHEYELKYSKGNFIVLNRERIDPENEFIIEGTLLNYPNISGWLDSRNIDAQLSTIDIEETNIQLIVEQCKDFLCAFNEQNEVFKYFINDLSYLILKADILGGEKLFNFLNKFYEFNHYFVKLLEADR